jgi:hypothetical protein
MVEAIYNSLELRAFMAGLQIDMRAINEISVSGDRTITTAGAGAKWGAVSMILDALELAVTEGRAKDVGVGGFIGGGMKAPNCTQLNIS